MPFPKKKNPKLQAASKKGHLARWGNKIKVEAEAELPLPLLELPEELHALIFEAVGCRGVGAVAQVCHELAAVAPPLARAIAAAEDAAAAAAAAAAAKAAAEQPPTARQRRVAARLAAEARRERLVGARLRVLLDAGNALERWAAGTIVDYTMDGEPTIAGSGSYYTFYMEDNGGYVDERWAADGEFGKWCCMCEVSVNECEVCAQGRTRSFIVTDLPQ